MFAATAIPLKVPLLSLKHSYFQTSLKIFLPKVCCFEFYRYFCHVFYAFSKQKTHVDIGKGFTLPITYHL